MTHDPPASIRVAAYTPDLMDRSKIAAAAPGCRFVHRPEALVGLAGTDVVVVDLAKKGVMDVLADVAAGDARVIAYGSHVDRALLAAAHDAGCDEVLPRSQFFSRLPQLLA
ncbi:MAG: hypothetical protein KY454_03180 [Actinobacteria bacterium]|nr:hypothetical protein [Actinomycetota bacterium]MBW3650802.1 hypothetical protein [Actinomycetota bacterium]